MQRVLRYVPKSLVLTHTELILGFVEKGPTPPLCSQKGGQPSNQMGNGIFLKKKANQPFTPKKNQAGVVFRCWPVLFTPQPQ